MIELLGQVRDWLRVGFYINAKQILAEVLDDEKKDAHINWLMEPYLLNKQKKRYLWDRTRF
jgi:hypothetical protein